MYFKVCTLGRYLYNDVMINDLTPPPAVQSPSEFLNKKPQLPSPSVLDRRQSIAVVEGLVNNNRVSPSHPPTTTTAATPPPNHVFERKYSLQVTGIGEGQSLVDAMSARRSPGLAEMAMANNREDLVRSVSTCGVPNTQYPIPIPVSQSSNTYIPIQMKVELLEKLEVLAPHLPTNTLDELVDGLGGPDKVAEMTGRRGRVVSLPNGGVQYQLRSESDVSMEILNIAEKQRFMDGEKVWVSGGRRGRKREKEREREREK